MIATANICAVVLDIEGTTSSIAFVKDELFPFARRHMTAYVREHEAAIAAILDQVRSAEGNPELDTEHLIAILLRWMDEDRKLSPLKTLQGLIWQRGFDSGELRAHFYVDAVRAIRHWHHGGVQIYIYSSGSVAAQKLLFSHTSYGDLTPLLSGHFDTTTGSKLEARSYQAIAKSIGQPAAAILFLSDHALEIQAATAAGMQAILVNREAAPGSDVNANIISNFDDLALTAAPRRAACAAPRGYRMLAPQTVPDYLLGYPDMAAHLGGNCTQWRTREVGDGNLNLVFIVEGPAASVVVKQALPYVRLVGESWPLPLSRSHFEYLALAEQARWARQFVPAVFHADREMALIVMEYLAPHVVLRKGLISGARYPRVAEHLASFLARTLYYTSDLFLDAEAKKQRIGTFLGNTAMCKISEDLIFDEPYFGAPMNRHTSPQLDSLAAELRRDAKLKLAVQEMKWQFQNAPEALVHGDLHTGSVMVTDDDTRVIDPEFAFYGPMGFDIGAITGNLLMAYLSQPGHEKERGDREQHRNYILQQLVTLWEAFGHSFAELWRQRHVGAPGGDLYQPRLSVDAPDLLPLAIEARLAAIWHQTLGFAGSKMIRRIAGLAHVGDFEGIGDPDVRAGCERHTVELARDLLLHRDRYADVQDVVEAARRYG